MDKNINELISEISDIASLKNNNGYLTSGALQDNLSVFSETNITTLSVSNPEELAQLLSIFTNVMRLRSEKDSISKSLKKILIDISIELYGKGATVSRLTAQDCENALPTIKNILNIEFKINDYSDFDEAIKFFNPYIEEYLKSRSTLESFLSLKYAGEFLRSIDLNDNGPFSIAAGVTTHPVKFDERVRTLENIYFPVQYNSETHGLSGFNTKLRRTLTVSLNAALLSHRFLLSLEYTYKDKKTSLVEMLLNDSDALETAFKLITGDEVLFNNIKSTIKKGTGQLKSVVGKQVYYPVDDEERDLDYHLLTPVISAGFQRELINQVIHGLKENALNEIYYYPLSKSSIGGAQPQNTSYLNSKLGGVNSMLKFTLPPTGNLGAVESALIKTGSLFLTPKKIPASLKVKEVHFKARYSFNKDVFQYCLEATSLFDLYRDNISTYLEKGMAPKGKVENKIIEFLKLTVSEKSEIKSILQTMLFKDLAKNKALLTLDIRDHSSKAIDNFVEKCF